MHEGDEPDFIAHLLDSHIVSGEHLTEVDLSSFEADASALSDGDSVIVKRVFELARGRDTDAVRVDRARRGISC